MSSVGSRSNSCHLSWSNGRSCQSQNWFRPACCNCCLGCWFPMIVRVACWSIGVGRVGRRFDAELFSELQLFSRRVVVVCPRPCGVGAEVGCPTLPTPLGAYVQGRSPPLRQRVDPSSGSQGARYRNLGHRLVRSRVLICQREVL